MPITRSSSRASAFELGPFELALHPRHPFDPRAERAGHPDAARHTSSTPATGSSTRRRWSAPSPTRPRCAGSATRACWRWSAIRTNVFDAGHVRLRGRGRATALIELIAASRKGVVAVTCFASNVARIDTVIAGAQAAGRECRAGRPLDAPHDRGGARGRLLHRPAGPFVDEHEAGYCRATRSLLTLHRQPGRAARGAGAHRRAASIRTSASSRATPCIFSRADHPRQRAHDLRSAEPLAAAASRSITEERPLRPRLRPSLPRRAGADVPLDAAADRGAGARRGAPSARALALARAARCRRRWSPERRHGAPGPGAAPRSSTRCRPAVSVLENEELVDGGGELFGPAAGSWNHGTVLVGLVLDRYGSAAGDSPAYTFGASTGSERAAGSAPSKARSRTRWRSSRTRPRSTTSGRGRGPR